jgi:hypothetical protein
MPVALGRSKAVLKGPDDALIASLNMEDLDRVKRALENGANPNVLMKGSYEYTVNGERVAIDEYPVFSVLRVNGSSTRSPFSWISRGKAALTQRRGRR